MEGICSSETAADSQRTTRRYIPEVGTLWFLRRFVKLCFFPYNRNTFSNLKACGGLAPVTLLKRWTDRHIAAYAARSTEVLT
jgi:hypothetical protein